MSANAYAPGIVAHRLDAVSIKDNFADLHPPLDAHEAHVAADRCYFCYDAPCITACPTSIDIPLFIRQIGTATAEAAATTILSQNILGGMCARVCPTETLCEEACVREKAEGKPVEIGRLQRYATDRIMAKPHPFARAKPTGKKVAVVGAGPAGLACAHRLAMKGHSVDLYDAKSKAGGLNEYGIAAYKSVDDFAKKEVDWLLKIGGITPHFGKKLGTELMLSDLQKTHEAVFLGIGLGGVNALRAAGEEKAGVGSAVDFIADLRQSPDLSVLPVGRRVVVIGGGMTAVDAAVQSRLLGAQDVSIVYRRSRKNMSASKFEQDLASSKGVRIIHNAQPLHILGNGSVSGVQFGVTAAGPDGVVSTGETFMLEADQVFKAIGQTLMPVGNDIELEHGKIKVNATGATSLPGVWAGGDCATGGDDLTVTAVAQGRDAAEDIHRHLTT